MSNMDDSHLAENVKEILEPAPIGIQIIQDDKYVYVNQKTLDYIEYKKKEIIGKSYKGFLEIIHPEDREFIAEQIKTKQSGAPIEYTHYQFRGYTKNGEMRWFDNYSTSIKFNGKLADLVFFIDITEKKKQERMLEYYKKAIEGCDDLITAINKEYEYLFVNEAFLDYNQLERENVKGNTAEEVLGKDIFQNTLKPYLDKCFAGQTLNFEMQKTYPELGERELLVKYNPIEDESGEVSFITANIRDITDQKETKERLQETERDLQHLIDNSPFSIMLINQEAKVIDINAKFTELFGYEKEEIIGKNIFKSPVLHTSKIDLLIERFSKHLSGENLKPIQLKVTDKYGDDVFIDPRASVISIAGEKIVQVSMKDITEKKRAEEALKESEEKHRLITENINDLIAVVNKRFEYEYINETITKKVMGYTEEDVIGKSVLDFIHPEDLEGAKEEIKNGFIEGEGRGQVRFLHKDGDRVWLEVKGRTFTDSKGELKGLIISRDITEEMRAKEKLRKSEKKYRQMAELLPDVIYQSDIDGNITYVNPIAYEIFGYTPQEFEEGISITDLIHEKYKEKAFNIRRKLLQEGKVQPTDVIFIKKDGSKFYGRFNSGVRYKDGEPVGFRGTVSDVSDLIKTHKKLEKSKKEYKKAYDRSDFFKNLLAHDIANVLNNIELSLNLVKMKTKTEEIPEIMEESVEMIHSQVQKGTELISNVRKIDKIKRSDVQLSKTNVLEVLKGVIESSSILKQDNVSIEIENEVDEPYIMAGPFLQDAFENVLINGVQHNLSKIREIMVSISEAERINKPSIQIDFIDNGIGIPDEDKKEIFNGNEPSYRSSKGMGLGLSLVQSIVIAYEGIISVRNRVKDDYTQGTIFTLKFPLVKS